MEDRRANTNRFRGRLIFSEERLAVEGRRAKQIESGANWYFPRKGLLWRAAGQNKKSSADRYIPHRDLLKTKACMGTIELAQGMSGLVTTGGETYEMA